LTHTPLLVSLIVVFIVSDSFEMLLPIRSIFEKSSNVL
jgi:hypothetical protein